MRKKARISTLRTTDFDRFSAFKDAGKALFKAYFVNKYA